MFKLGVKAFKTDSRTLRLQKYMTAIAPPPESVNWDAGSAFGMMLNDTLGDCTIAGLGHAVQVWTIHASKEATVPDSTVEQYYSLWCGYVPGDPSTDNGGVELDVLKAFQSSGFGGHKLAAFADPPVSDLTRIKQAVYLFGGLYIGFNVTQSVMNTDTDPSVPWDTTGDNTSVGGHCVFVIGYTPQFLYVISWGQIYKMTWAYWLANVSEAHALLSPDMIASTGLAASGFNTTQLMADLAAIV